MIQKIIKLIRPFRYWYDKKTFQKSFHAEEIEKMRDKVKGRPLLIVGNGPSLNNTPLNCFNNVFSIGMNKIDLLFDKTTWRPNLVIATNPLVVKQHWHRMLEHNDDVYLSWKNRYFVPKAIRGQFKFFLCSNDASFQADISKSVGSLATVTYSALQFAFYLGANPVILLGVDHNFSSIGNPYDYKKRLGEDVNHFDPNYFASGQYWGVPNLSDSEKAFEAAKLAFEEDGRIVYDATIEGKLNVFPKISIDEALTILEHADN